MRGPFSSYSGYSLEASTASNFTGTLISSVTPVGSLTSLTFNQAQLAPNTTYFVRVGSLWNGATTYADTVPGSTSTLTSSLKIGRALGTYTSSVTLNWTAFTSDSGAS